MAIAAAGCGALLAGLGAAAPAAGSAGSGNSASTANGARRQLVAAGSALPAFSRPPVATELSGVSCRSTSLCMAVGITGIIPGLVHLHMATEIWNGRSWHGLATPASVEAGGPSEMSGVSCASRTRCMAIGAIHPVPRTGHPFAVSWNGRRWRMLAVAPLAGSLHGISCPAPARCMAVGRNRSSGGAAAELWDGTSWRLLPLPALPGSAGGSLSAVSCTGTARCIAVGSYFPATAQGRVPLAEAWDGTSWRVLATPTLGPNDSELSGISCTSASSCIAVGAQNVVQNRINGVTSSDALAERWDGQNWTVLAGAVPAGAQGSSLAGVSCRSAASCMAVGTSGLPQFGPVSVLTERWNGSSWQVLAAPGPFPDENTLGSVSCPAADGCMAVGNGHYTAPQGTQFDSLSEQWDGVSWQVRRSGQIDVLAGVSCLSAARCVAAGGYISRADRGVTLAEAWNGRRWRHRDTPTPVPFETLSDISCTGPAFCMAVGALPAFAERWNGTRWRPAGSLPFDGPVAVSCASATRCMAVSGQQGGAAEWNGRRWRSVPGPHGLFLFNDVACPAASRCIAVGGGAASAAEWNGRRWHFLATSVRADLFGVDCVGPSSCMAVGFAGGSSGVGRSVAERWNGRTWRARTHLGPVGFTGLLDVSCPSAARCMAVGWSAGPGHRSFATAFTERWNGRKWRLIRPAGRSAALVSVSCARPGRCIAVGQAGTLTLAEQWTGTRWRRLRTRNP